MYAVSGSCNVYVSQLLTNHPAFCMLRLCLSSVVFLFCNSGVLTFL